MDVTLCDLHYYMNTVNFQHIYTLGVSRLVDITAEGDILGLCDQNFM